MQRKIKLNLQKKKIARNGFCKETILQVEATFFYHTVNVSYLKINVQTTDIISKFKMFESFCGLNVQLILTGVKFTFIHLWSSVYSIKIKYALGPTLNV